MNRRMIGNALAVVALLCFIAAIVGMATGGSHRWVEPVEEAGWMFFVGCVLVLYLLAKPPSQEPLNAGWVKAAWALGALSIALLLVAFISNLAAQQYKYWYEAIDTAGLVAMVLTIIASVMARGGFSRTAK